MSSGEVRRTERWLASARVSLAVASLVAIWMDPGQIRYSIWAYGLLAFYIAQGVNIIIFLRRRQQSTASFRLLVHSADVVWPAVISIFAMGESNPFFLFFVFVLAAAAYRWGLFETVGTAIAAVSLLWIESLSFHWGLISWIDGFLVHHHLPALRVDATFFEPRGLVMRSVYLVVLGFLLGIPGRAAEAASRREGSHCPDDQPSSSRSRGRGTLQGIADELVSLYGAKHLLLVSQEVKNYRIFVAELSVSPEETSFRWLEPAATDRETYMHETPAAASYAERSNRAAQRRILAFGTG